MSAAPVDEVAQLAINLARSAGYAVFPCLENKRPACPQGFKSASTDPTAISRLWWDHLGALIGIATGKTSGVDVLDVDIKHTAALVWWRANEPRLPVTRAYRTRSGGIHLYFRHEAGVGCSAGKLAAGVDTRGDGGYVVSWFAAGLPCLDHSPPAGWPAWLLAELRSRPAPAPPLRPPSPRGDRAIDGALRLVATAAEGERNAVLHWAACRLAERVRDGQISANEAEALLVAAGRAAGLPEPEARATARSGLRRRAAA
jgi:Bifunctional DNA primase/polymerase, N-terminal